MEPVVSIASVAIATAEIIQPVIRKCTDYQQTLEYTQALIRSLLEEAQDFKDLLDRAADLPLPRKLELECISRQHIAEDIKMDLAKLKKKYASSSKGRTMSTMTGSDKAKLDALQQTLRSIKKWVKRHAENLRTVPQEPAVEYHNNGSLWWQN